MKGVKFQISSMVEEVEDKIKKITMVIEKITKVKEKFTMIIKDNGESQNQNEKRECCICKGLLS